MAVLSKTFSQTFEWGQSQDKFDLFRLGPEVEIGQMWQSEPMLSIVLGGGYYKESDTETANVQSGSIAFIPRQFMEYSKNGQDGSFLLNVFLSESNIKKIKSVLGSNVDSVIRIDDSFIDGTAIKLFNALFKTGKNADLEIAHTIQTIVTTFMQRTCISDREDGKPNQLKRFLKDRFDQPIRIGDACRVLNRNPEHLIRAFSAEFGLTPLSYLQHIRFRKSLQYLFKNSGTTMADVAHRCGYADQGHFCRQFKRFAGITPKQCWKRFNALRSRALA